MDFIHLDVPTGKFLFVDQCCTSLIKAQPFDTLDILICLDGFFDRVLLVIDVGFDHRIDDSLYLIVIERWVTGLLIVFQRFTKDCLFLQLLTEHGTDERCQCVVATSFLDLFRCLEWLGSQFDFISIFFTQEFKPCLRKFCHFILERVVHPFICTIVND